MKKSAFFLSLLLGACQPAETPNHPAPQIKKESPVVENIKNAEKTADPAAELEKMTLPLNVLKDLGVVKKEAPARQESLETAEELGQMAMPLNILKDLGKMEAPEKNKALLDFAAQLLKGADKTKEENAVGQSLEDFSKTPSEENAARVLEEAFSLLKKMSPPPKEPSPFKDQGDFEREAHSTE